MTEPEPIERDPGAMRREQELCLRALESHVYDTMSDEEWVNLCEKTGKSAPAFSK